MGLNNRQLYKKLISDVFSYGFLDSLTRLLNFLLLPILTRAFSSAEYGAIDLIAAFTSFLLPFSTLGLQGSLARYYQGKEKSEKDSILYSSLVVFNVFISFIIIVLVFSFSSQISLLIAKSTEYSIYIRIGSAGAFFNSLASLPQMLLRRRRKIKLFGSIKIVTSVFYVGLTLLFIYPLQQGIKGVFLAQAIAFFVGFLLSAGFVWRYFQWNFDYSVLRRSLKFSLPMFPSIFVNWANEQFNRFIIVNFLNVSLLGLFGAVFRVSGVIRILTQIFRKAWMPLSMEIIDEKHRGKMISGTLKYYFTFFFLLSLVFSLFSPEIVGILLPEKYFSAYKLVPWITGAFVIHHSGTILNMGSIIKERTSINSIAAWTGFAINVTLCLLLVKPLGILSAAIGLFVANLTASTILLWKTEKISEIRFDKLYIFALVFIYIISNLIIIHLFQNTENIFLSLALRILVLLLTVFIIDRIITTHLITKILGEVVHKTKIALRNISS